MAQPPRANIMFDAEAFPRAVNENPGMKLVDYMATELAKSMVERKKPSNDEDIP